MRARRGRSRTGSLRIRSLILLGMLVPLVGLALVAGSSVRDHQADRDASVRLRDAAAGVRAGVDFRAAVATEEIHSTILGLARDLGVDLDDTEHVDGRRVLTDLARARLAVEEGRRDHARGAVADDLRRLDELRADLDAGRAGQAAVSDVFADLNRALAEQWTSDLARIEESADLQSLTGGLRDRLRTLRYSIEAFALGGPRIHVALDILLDRPTTSRTELLIRLDDQFATAAQRADPAAGTAAATAWSRFGEDEAARRTEATLDTAVAVGLGELPPWGELELGLVAAGLTDGQRWGLLLTEVVGAAARDLSAAAGDHAADTGDAVRTESAVALCLVLLSVVVGLATARTLVGPARDLQAAARRVETGDFDAEPVRVRGPAELRATVSAFNDMTATLAAVEDHVVALAADPAAPVLDDPLPGRTGFALQQAIDQLRSSVDQAESHRAELFELATRDGLTGLLNRAAAFAAIQQDLGRARRDGTQLLALYIDLDGLKELNDTYGHDIGDEAIGQTADALRATTRDSDVVARLGGDEFMVVGPIPEGGREAIVAFAERVHAAVALRSVAVVASGGTRDLPLRCSIGVAVSDPLTDSAESLVSAADEAMYRAKHAGRHRVAWTETGRPPEGSTST